MKKTDGGSVYIYFVIGVVKAEDRQNLQGI